MAKERLKIIDGSEDKKYFTIIPNYVYNHATLWDREVYAQMKRISGENGTCWISRTKLAKQCGMSLHRLRKSLKYLLEHEWIAKIGTKAVETPGGVQEVSEYKVRGLWKKNMEYFETKKSKGGAQETPPTPQRGGPDEAQGGAQKGGPRMTTKNNQLEEEPLNNNHDIAKSSDFAGKIAQIIKLFEPVNATIGRFYANTTQRAAVERMIKAYGFDKLAEMVKALPLANAKQFWPKSTTPVELEKNIPIYSAKQSEEKSNKKIILEL